MATRNSKNAIHNIKIHVHVHIMVDSLNVDTQRLYTIYWAVENFMNFICRLACRSAQFAKNYFIFICEEVIFIP